MFFVSKETHREYWDKLQAYADEENIPAFYSLYSEYLEKCGIYSPSRIAIHKMAKVVVEKMK